MIPCLTRIRMNINTNTCFRGVREREVHFLGVSEGAEKLPYRLCISCQLNETTQLLCAASDSSQDDIPTMNVTRAIPPVRHSAASSISSISHLYIHRVKHYVVLHGHFPRPRKLCTRGLAEVQRENSTMGHNTTQQHSLTLCQL